MEVQMKKSIYMPFLALLAALLIAAPTLGMTQKDEFLTAASSGNAKVVKMLLDSAGDNARELLTATTEYGHTPLHKAASSGNAEVVKMILDSAGDNARELLTTTDTDEETPLHNAAFLGHAKVVKMILDSAGEKARELLTATDKHENTPLHKAAYSGNAEVVKVILDSAGEKARELLTATDKYEETPLHGAVSCRNAEPLRVLLERGANPYLLNFNGKTAEDLARDRRLPKIVHLLANWTEQSLERRKLESKRDIARTRQFYHLWKNHPLAIGTIKERIGAFLTPEPTNVLIEEEKIIHMPETQRARERRRLETPDKLRVASGHRQDIEKQEMFERQHIKDALHALHRQ